MFFIIVVSFGNDIDCFAYHARAQVAHVKYARTDGNPQSSVVL